MFRLHRITEHVWKFSLLLINGYEVPQTIVQQLNHKKINHQEYIKYTP
jgi:hypothetical protein